MATEPETLQNDIRSLTADHRAATARIDGSVEKLKSDVNELQRAKSWFQGSIAVLTLLGILGAGTLTFLWKQLTSLNDEIGKAQKQLTEIQDSVKRLPQQLEETMNALIARGKSELEQTIAGGKGELQKKTTDLKETLPPAVNLLDTAHQFVFVNQRTGELHPRPIENMTADGAAVDCGDKVPTGAKGVIIAVLVLRPSDHPNAIFFCSDANGSFTEPLNGQAVNGIFNYTEAWIGGILFCPFINGTKEFRYKVGSSNGAPDTGVGCRGAVIGWF